MALDPLIILDRQIEKCKAQKLLNCKQAHEEFILRQCRESGDEALYWCVSKALEPKGNGIYYRQSLKPTKQQRKCINKRVQNMILALFNVLHR